MGKIICDRHGEAGIALVCRHIAAAVVNDAPLPSYEMVEVRDPALESFGRLEFPYCSACIATGLQRHLNGDQLEQLSAELKPQPVCARCFERQRCA